MVRVPPRLEDHADGRRGAGGGAVRRAHAASGRHPAGRFFGWRIGITPFRSIIVQAQRDDRGRRLFLFYSSHRPEDAAFLEELQALGQQNPQFTFVGTMTGMDTSRRAWSGETGFANQEMLGRFVGDLAAPIYYIAGPPGMVSATQLLSSGAKVSEDSVRVEEFARY